MIWVLNYDITNPNTFSPHTAFLLNITPIGSGEKHVEEYVHPYSRRREDGGAENLGFGDSKLG